MGPLPGFSFGKFFDASDLICYCLYSHLHECFDFWRSLRLLLLIPASLYFQHVLVVVPFSAIKPVSIIVHISLNIFQDAEKIRKIFPSGIPVDRFQKRILGLYNGLHVVASDAATGMLELRLLRVKIMAANDPVKPVVLGLIGIRGVFSHAYARPVSVFPLAAEYR